MTTSIAGVTLATLLNIESRFTSLHDKRVSFCVEAGRHVSSTRYTQIVNTALDLHEAEMLQIDAITTKRLIRMRDIRLQGRERKAGR